MQFSDYFIKATDKFNELDAPVAAPFFRKVFDLPDFPATSADLIICSPGFYTLHINGKEITKGALAPYISNPDDILYYDKYEITQYIRKGKNVIGIWLGNGFFNDPGGHIWDFDRAVWRGSLRVAVNAEIRYISGETTGGDEEIVSIRGDENFLTAPSPILSDDYRCGETYDARFEIPGWDSDPDMDTSGWICAERAEIPRGEKRFCEAEPITVKRILKPVSVSYLPEQYGCHLFDFGVNASGVCKLKIRGKKGQKLTMYHGEILNDEGRLDRTNIGFPQNSAELNDLIQKDTYICKGSTEEDGSYETYVPRFVYHGFRYVEVHGLEAEQLSEDTLEYLVMNSDLREVGGFECSDEVANELQNMTRVSDLANFYYFPTDCPHREKNGWTGDAALSAEHMLLNLSVEKSLKEWLRNIRKAQADDGSLPGIVPTSGWGFAWGNGPVWDAVLTWLPWEIYRFRGDRSVLEENATSIFRYLSYIAGRRDAQGLVAIGLGDWCPPGRLAHDYESPLILTDSVMVMDIAKKAAGIFDILGMEIHKVFAGRLAEEMREAIRENLIDRVTMTAAGNCQTSQAICIYYGVLDESEKEGAVKVLLDQIHKAGDHITTGIVGGRVIFHVLSDAGYADLAYKMITRPEYPSYGNWILRGATSLWEDFKPENAAPNSRNHHFWGDISNWFISVLAGIRVNPEVTDPNKVIIKPVFIEALDSCKGWHEIPAGKVSVEWERGKDSGTFAETVSMIELEVEVPGGCEVSIEMPKGWIISDKDENSLVIATQTDIKLNIKCFEKC